MGDGTTIDARALMDALWACARSIASETARVARGNDFIATGLALAIVNALASRTRRGVDRIARAVEKMLFVTVIVAGERGSAEVENARAVLRLMSRGDVARARYAGREDDDIVLEPVLRGKSVVVRMNGYEARLTCRGGSFGEASSVGSSDGESSWYSAFVNGASSFGASAAGGKMNGAPAEGSSSDYFTIRVFRLFRSRRWTKECVREMLRLGAEARERERKAGTEFTRVHMPRTVVEYSAPSSRHEGGGHRVYRGEQHWVPSEKPSRPLDTVVLPTGARDMIERDVREFLDSERWYVDRGLPYRRGYLLHGLPGTGKTSLVFALAGHFGLPLYVVRLSDERLCDEGLHRLFRTTEKRSIILLDDVDAPGANEVFRELQPGESTGNLSVQSTLSLLDGVTSVDGRLIFLSCRDKSALNQTLIRPGRFDVILRFDAPGKEQIESYFNHFFADFGGDVPSMGAEFAELAAHVDTQPKSMAALQVLFLSHKSNPRDALESMRARISGQKRSITFGARSRNSRRDHSAAAA